MLDYELDDLFGFRPTFERVINILVEMVHFTLY